MKLILTALILIACYQASSTTVDDVSTKTKAAASAAVDYTVEQKEAFQKSMDENLTALKAEVANLKEKAATAQGDAKAKANAKIIEAEVKQAELQVKMAKLKKSSGRAWAKMKDGMSSAWTKAKDTVSEAQSELKK